MTRDSWKKRGYLNPGETMTPARLGIKRLEPSGALAAQALAQRVKPC